MWITPVDNVNNHQKSFGVIQMNPVKSSRKESAKKNGTGKTDSVSAFRLRRQAKAAA
jgi:hypothetical protein